MAKRKYFTFFRGKGKVSKGDFYVTLAIIIICTIAIFSGCASPCKDFVLQIEKNTNEFFPQFKTAIDVMDRNQLDTVFGFPSGTMAGASTEVVDDFRKMKKIEIDSCAELIRTKKEIEEKK